MYQGDDQVFVDNVKAESLFLVENQGNQCFSTSMFFVLFSEEAIRQAIIGIYIYYRYLEQSLK